MGRTTWLARLGPPLLVLVAIAGPASAGQFGGRLDPPGTCRDRFDEPALDVPSPSIERASDGAWYRLGPVLDAAGTLVGQRLEAGMRGGTIRRDLPAESSVAGPFGSAILVTSDDGAFSTVRLVDVQTGCDREVDRAASVIRRATIDVATRTVHEHRVDRVSRASLGVWRRAADAAGADRILEPIADDATFGPTFSTELTWSTDGGRLAVQSCGSAACRTRILDPRGGPVQVVADRSLGEIVAIAGDRLVTYGACRVLPCPLVSTSLTDGSRMLLAENAGLARSFLTDRGPRIAFERGEIGSGRIVIATADLGPDGTIDIGPGRLLVPSAARAGEAYDGPKGWLLLDADGRDGDAMPRHELLEPSDGRRLDLPTEVLP